MVTIDTVLVKKLISTQFPQWAHLPIFQVEPGGWDNRTFRLGDTLSVPLPSSACYAPQIEKEFKWLPYLSTLLPLAIPAPLALGKPGEGYPYKWGVYRWIEGTTATQGLLYDKACFASQLGEFLKRLHQIDTTEGPLPGAHNFYRGGNLSVYDEETRQALELLKGESYAPGLQELWEQARASSWERDPVWIHGDLVPSNLLVKKGKLSAVIDFGLCGIGDPACDLVIAWTFFTGESRKAFQEAVALDNSTWERARGWALWKALIVVADLSKHACNVQDQSKRVIQELLRNCKQR